MQVTIDVCAVLRGCCRADGRGFEGGPTEIAENDTLGDVLGRLSLPEQLKWIACVNGRPSPPDTSLSEGDHLYVFLPVSGG
ncbi:MAG TPA: MoaD/ThiS family protein [Thermoleophilia bacterium]|nr:MoaD/ThiS family protein [Thermoleophilia bacterium]